jgi:outer membrane protein
MSLARCFCAATWVALVTPVFASDPGDDPWVVKVGVHDVDPKSDNGQLAGGTLNVDVGSSVRPTASLEYLFVPNLGVELLAAWPFEHDIKLNGTLAANARELPPTLSLQYHFTPTGAVSPFIGIGLNYTRFFDVDERGPLAGTRLDLSNSFGFAAHAGLDFRITERWLAGVDVRWINIETDARVDGTKVGTVNISPLVYGLYAGYRF